MSLPAIIGLASGLPGACYLQEEILEQLRPHLNGNGRAGHIFEAAGVGSRYLVVDGRYYDQERTTQARNEMYMQHAIPLGEDVIRRCLESAGKSAADIDDLIVVSCTGIDTPGLDLHLAGRLSMSPWLHRTCVLGMGCYGVFPALLRAREAALSRPGRTVLVLSVELCSLHFQPGDGSMENIVSSALFADGAAAALVSVPDDDAPVVRYAGPALVDSVTYCDYQTFDHMAFHLTDHGFHMSLSAYVPKLLGAKVEGFIDGLFDRNGLRPSDVRHWGVHPGSSRILDYVQERLGLTERQVSPSRAVLHRFGNMSSATILFVLEEIQRQRQPAPGEYGVLMSLAPA